MIGDMKENVIEWYTSSNTCTVTFTQKKFINRIRKMQRTFGECVEIVAENPDGSVTAHIPVKAVHLWIYGSKNGESCGGTDEEEDDERFD